MARPLILATASMTKAQRDSISYAARNLIEARRCQAQFALVGYQNGLARVPTMRTLKAAENAFWRACYALVADEDTGPRDR